MVSSGWERAKVGRRVSNPNVWIQVIGRGKNIFSFNRISFHRWFSQRRQPRLSSLVWWPPKPSHQIPGMTLNQTVDLNIWTLGGKTFGDERSGVLDVQLFGLFQHSHGGRDVGRNTTDQHVLGKKSIAKLVCNVIINSGSRINIVEGIMTFFGKRDGHRV